VSEVKRARPEYPVMDVVANRWSPYVFADRAVARGDLLSLFEAARWAASSYNEQPWRYIVATREDPDAHARVLSCLVEPNQAWAKQAPVLALGVIGLQFERNGKPNAAAQHDLGLASANLTLEATQRGLSVHQMIGILPDRAKEIFDVPDGYQVLTGLAIGYAGDPVVVEGLGPRDLAARGRRPVAEFVFTNGWGRSFAAPA